MLGPFPFLQPTPGVVTSNKTFLGMEYACRGSDAVDQNSFSGITRSHVKLWLVLGVLPNCRILEIVGIYSVVLGREQARYCKIMHE